MGKDKGRKKKKTSKQGGNVLLEHLFKTKIKRRGIFSNDNIEFIYGKDEKMSEVLLDFAEPLLKTVENDYIAIKNAIGFAAIVWNFSLLPEREQKKEINIILKTAPNDDDEMQNAIYSIVEMLLDRKKRYFPDNRRLIVDYEFSMKNGQPWLNVVSTVV